MENKAKILGLQATLATSYGGFIDTIEGYLDTIKTFQNATILHDLDESKLDELQKRMREDLEQIRHLHKFYKHESMELVNKAEYNSDVLKEMLEGINELIPMKNVDMKEEIEPLIAILEACKSIENTLEKKSDTWINELLALVDSEFGVYIDTDPTLPTPTSLSDFIDDLLKNGEAHGITFLPMDKVEDIVPMSEILKVSAVFSKFANRMKELQNILKINLEDSITAKNLETVKKELQKKFKAFCKKYEKIYSAPLKNILKSYIAELRGY